jgi:antirestriction protein ArdC
MAEETKRVGKSYEVVTSRILELLESGEIPWRKPWRGAGGLPKNLTSGRTYRGVNVFLLTCISAMVGYSSSYWVTFRQAKALGGHVKKGEKSSPVVFWKLLEKGKEGEADEPRGEDDTRRMIPLLRHYNVFNLEQCEGIDPPADEAEGEPLDFTPIEACERIVADMPDPPKLEVRGLKAYYRPSEDLVMMPTPERFESAEEYYGTLFHELTHSTGHARRLNRGSVADAAPFGSQTYGNEELVAEMGASFLCGHAGIENVTLENSAAYIQGWLKTIRSDPKLVVVAAAQAQKAADWILHQTER